MDDKLYSIMDAAKFLSLTPSYIRSLIRHKKIGSSLEPTHEGSEVKKHMITREELVRYRDHTPRKSKRSDGRHKYLIYMSDHEVDPALKALFDAGLEGVADTIKAANLRKPR